MIAEKPLDVQTGDHVVVVDRLSETVVANRTVRSIAQDGAVRLDDGTRWRPDGQPRGANHADRVVARDLQDYQDRKKRSYIGRKLAYLAQKISDGTLPREQVNVILSGLQNGAGIDLSQGSLEKMVAGYDRADPGPVVRECDGASDQDCAIRWCESGEPAQVPVNDVQEDASFRVQICQCCATELGVHAGEDLPEPDIVKEILDRRARASRSP